LGGTNESSKRSFDDVINEVSQKGGICGGSFYDTANRWYNFLYIPHRTGSGGDNTKWGSCLFFDMTSNTGNIYLKHRMNGVNQSLIAFNANSSSAISSEATTRANEDKKLQTSIANEVTTRTNEDKKLLATINATMSVCEKEMATEKNERTGAINSLTTVLRSLKTNCSNLNTNYNSLSTTVSKLQTQVNNNTSGVQILANNIHVHFRAGAWHDTGIVLPKIAGVGLLQICQNGADTGFVTSINTVATKYQETNGVVWNMNLTALIPTQLSCNDGNYTIIEIPVSVSFHAINESIPLHGGNNKPSTNYQLGLKLMKNSDEGIDKSSMILLIKSPNTHVMTLTIKFKQLM